MTTNLTIGDTVKITLEGLTIPCRVLATRVLFGRSEVQITPANGSGSKWVVVAKCARGAA